jgi:hypothetical protein
LLSIGALIEYQELWPETDLRAALGGEEDGHEREGWIVEGGDSSPHTFFFAHRDDVRIEVVIEWFEPWVHTTQIIEQRQTSYKTVL